MKLFAKMWLLTISLSYMVFCASGCTENQRAKSFGGEQTVELKNERLVNVTWKEAELWYLTRPLKSDEEPVTWKFQEKSSFGVLEGRVIFKESK